MEVMKAVDENPIASSDITIWVFWLKHNALQKWKIFTNYSHLIAAVFLIFKTHLNVTR